MTNTRWVIEQLIDSLEYVDRHHPETTGGSTRGLRIEQARQLLDKLPGALPRMTLDECEHASPQRIIAEMLEYYTLPSRFA